MASNGHQGMLEHSEVTEIAQMAEVAEVAEITEITEITWIAEMSQIAQIAQISSDARARGSDDRGPQRGASEDQDDACTHTHDGEGARAGGCSDWLLHTPGLVPLLPGSFLSRDFPSGRSGQPRCVSGL